MGQQRAFRDYHMLEIIRQAGGTQRLFNVGHVATGALEPEDDLGLVPEDQEQFLLEPLPDLRLPDGNCFATEIQGFLDPEKGNKGGGAGSGANFRGTGPGRCTGKK